MLVGREGGRCISFLMVLLTASTPLNPKERKGLELHEVGPECPMGVILITGTVCTYVGGHFCPSIDLCSVHSSSSTNLNTR